MSRRDAEQFGHLHRCVAFLRPPDISVDRAHEFWPAGHARTSARIPQYGITALSRNAPSASGCRLDAASGWNGIRHYRGVLDRNPLLIRIERADQIERHALDLEHSNSCETTCSTFARSEPMKFGVIASSSPTTAQLIARWCPSNWNPTARPQRAHEEGHEIWPFAVVIESAGQLSEQVVETHDVASLRSHVDSVTRSKSRNAFR